MSRTSLPSLKVCSTIARIDVRSWSLIAKPDKSTSSNISGKSMSKSGKSPLCPLEDENDDVDEEEGEVSDVMRLRGRHIGEDDEKQIGDDEKLAPKLLSADECSAGDRIGSWKKNILKSV